MDILCKSKIRILKKKIRQLQINIRYYLDRERCYYTYSFAHEKLSSFHPMPTASAIRCHKVKKPEYDLVIIIPVYNAEKWIESCIQSVLRQETKYSYKVKIINDGSTDESKDIIESFFDEPHVQIINQENRGYSGARNRGLEILESKYIMFVDADDYLLPGAITLLLEKAEQTGAAIVEGNGFRFDENGKIGPVKRANTISGVPWMKIMKASLFEEIEFPEGFLYEDKIIGSLILQKANKIELIPDEVYAYRVHKDSISQTHDANPKRLDSYWMMWRMQYDQELIGILPDYTNYIRAMRQIVFTYRRTICFPEEIKKMIFIGSKYFIELYYSDFMETDDKCKKLAYALQKNKYGKYKVFCECYMI